MKQQPITLPKDSNPDYHALIERHNAIMLKWTGLNKGMRTFRLHGVFLFTQRTILREYGKQLKDLQDEFLAWNADIYDFIVHPNLILPDGADSHISFPHYMGLLKDMRNRMDSYMVIIVHNFNRINDGYSNKINFLIAIASFWISFVGLVIAILTFK